MMKSSHSGSRLLPAIAALVLLFCATEIANASGRVLILAYHSFTGKGTSSMDFTLEELAGQLERFRSLGYSLVSITDAIEGRIEGDRNIVISIDDGNHTVYRAWTEVFRPRGIKPLLFIYPAILGKVAYALTNEQLRELSDNGCVVASHGYNHEYLHQKAFLADPKTSRREITKPGPILETLTGKKVWLFGYPFGVGARESGDLIKNSGYEWAFLADGDIRTISFSDPALDHFAVPRTIVFRSNISTLLSWMEANAATAPKPRSIAGSGVAYGIGR